MTRVLVCGGRKYDDRAKVYRSLDYLNSIDPIEVIIQGGATGADHIALSWANSRWVECLTFHANWAEQGSNAGPIRNQRMLDEGKPDTVLAFPGGRGTADMVRRAKSQGLAVMEYET